MKKTIIYYTSNREDPEFEQKIIDDMLSKKGDIPIVSVSQKPMDLGQNICIGDVGMSELNCRKQILMACKLAKTEYVVAVEADTLYPPEYFNFELKGKNIYRYNNNWIMWLKDENRKDFYHKLTSYDGAQIVKRDYLIGLLEEFLKDYPGWYPVNDLKNKPNHNPYYKTARSYLPSENPLVCMKTEFGIHYTTTIDERPESTRKNLPYWGDVDELRNKFS